MFNDPRLCLLCDVIHPCKKLCGGCQVRIPRSIHPFIHISVNQRCPIQFRLKSVLGVHFSYVERNKFEIFPEFCWNGDQEGQEVQEKLTVFPFSVIDLVLRRPYTSPHTDISRHIVGWHDGPPLGFIKRTPFVVKPSIIFSSFCHFGAFSCQSICSC